MTNFKRIHLPNDRIIITALWLLMFSASSQLMILAPILPQVGSQLNIPASLQGTLVTAYAISLAIFAVIMGPVSDKIGRRRILLMGTGAMASALALHGLASDYGSFLLLRALAGAAGGVLSGASVSYVGDYFPYERRGWANGWIATGIATGQILGVPLGTILSEWFGVQGPFSLFALTMGLAFFLVWRYVPQPDVARTKERLTLSSALRKYAYLSSHGVTAATAAVYFLMFMGFSLYVVYLPTWLKASFGVDGHQIASLFLIGGIASVVTGPSAGKWSDRIGRRMIIVASCLGLSIVMSLTTVVVREFWTSYVLFLLMMMLVAARISPLQALISEIVPGDDRGAFMSLTIALGQLGMGLGGALAGPVYTNAGFVSNTLLGAASFVLMAGIVWWIIPEPGVKRSAVETNPTEKLEEAAA